jgi:hypothetical protein
MRDEMIALCVIDQNRPFIGSRHRSSRPYSGYGRSTAVPADDDVSYENARDQFRKARKIKKADRETRLLAKADRIRAAME